MVIVAVAGGGTGIGVDIIDAIRNTGKHELVVLSRSSQPRLDSLGVRVHVVDYSDPEQLKESLRDVHTVISCIAAYGSTSGTSELALLEAAKKAGVVRFVPSEWSGECHDIVDLYSAKPVVWKAVQASGLEYTRFVSGLWLNVWGPGCIRNQKEATGGYGARPPFAIDLKAGTAIIPGDDSQKVVVMRTQDIGKFVAASLDMPQWPHEMKVGGDRLTLTEVVELARTVCGKNLQITRLSVEELRGILQKGLSGGEQFYYQLLLAVATGRFDFESQSATLFPAIEPVTTVEYFQRYWA
ncbi:hypothetical protein NQ176_g2077 [Zarea fungicola]|uniref:Uncharacterized protein n=1 Tax=Zarea fungicola TaxID=93591 RepID=A0ACC1NRC5_9HYPO|nr:hypothetical protein NQ176_g2077 [Lecanicillium fungicola]